MPKNNNPIEVYTVTVLDVRNSDCPGYWRTPCIFTELEDAIQVVRGNDLDISENGTNQYAVVEKTFLNQVYPCAKERHWFEWSHEEEEYIAMDVPQKYTKVYAFGIG